MTAGEAIRTTVSISLIQFNNLNYKVSTAKRKHCDSRRYKQRVDRNTFYKWYELWRCFAKCKLVGWRELKILELIQLQVADCSAYLISFCIVVVLEHPFPSRTKLFPLIEADHHEACKCSVCIHFCAQRRHKISFNLESKADSNERWFHRFFETNMQFVCKKMNFLQYEHEK